MRTSRSVPPPERRYPAAIARSLALRRQGVLAVWPSLIYPATLVLALVLPFQTIRPVLVTPWLALGDQKLVLAALAAAWLLLGSSAWPTPHEWRAVAPSLALLLVCLIAALLAPAFRADALRFVGRLAAGPLVFLVVFRLAGDSRRLNGVLWALVLGGGASALLGLGEALGLGWLQPTLSLFKVAPTRVGGELRTSASFQYATIAAMYFEMLAPLAIVVCTRSGRRWSSCLALAVAGLCTLDVVLSLTRAGILTLAVVLSVLAACAWHISSYRRLLRPTVGVFGVLIAGVAYLAIRNPVFDMRLATESDADWYAAAYTAPGSLQLEPGQSVRVGLNIENRGRLAWSTLETHPFELGYRWLTADGASVLALPPGEVRLPEDVAPGERVHVDVLVGVPDLPAGSYRLDWGMLQPNVLRFSERGSEDAQTLVDVQPMAANQGAALPATLPLDDGQAPWVVGRLDLWQAALRLAASRPLIGVGPDNFRHLYGAELGLETWDERVQANNIYLELLADIGLLGLAAFGWMTLPPLGRLARRVFRRPAGAVSDLSLGAGLGILAFLVHGTLDAFLAFTPTALLMWMLLGALARGTQKPQVSGR